jgi:hypothetical protein
MGPTRKHYVLRYARDRDMSAAEEPEPEPSERPRRLRGRPRRDPSTDHGRGSSRSSRDDDVPQHTVGEEAVPQMYDNVVLPTSEEAVP